MENNLDELNLDDLEKKFKKFDENRKKLLRSFRDRYDYSINGKNLKENHKGVST